MNQLVKTFNSSDLTMTSLDIATLLNTQHNNVRISIERLAKKSVIQLPPMQLVEYKQSLSPNNKSKVYVFTGEQGKRDSIIVVAQLSPEFTARLVDRWQELEQSNQSINDTPAWIANLSPQASIAIEDLNNQMLALQDDNSRLQVVCNDLASNLNPGVTPTVFCRQLNGVNIQKVRKDLTKRGYLIETKNGYRSAAACRDKYFTERRNTTKDGYDYEEVVLTKLGSKWLYRMYEKGELTMKKNWDGEYSHPLHQDDEGYTS